MINYQTIRTSKTATVALWVSVGVVTAILGNAIYKNIRKKGSVTDGNEKLNTEMKNLIEAIDKQPK
jgi:hypothetical protein